jgi:hypothetical protein
MAFRVFPRVFLIPIAVVFSLFIFGCSNPTNPYTNPKNLSASLLMTNGLDKEVGDTVTLLFHVNLPSFVDSAELYWGDKTVERIPHSDFDKNGDLTIHHCYAAPESLTVSAVVFVSDGSRKSTVPFNFIINGTAPRLSLIADTVRSVRKGDGFSFSFFVNGTQPFTWTWKHGPDSVGASQLYRNTNAAFSDSGTYFCIVSNAWGADTSQIIRLAVVQDTVPFDSIADVASLLVMNTRDTTGPWMMVWAPSRNTVTSSVICNDTAFVRIVTAAKVSGLTINGKTVAPRDTTLKIYESKQLYLPAIGNNVFAVEVVSQNRKFTKTYTLTIPSSLRPAIDASVLRPDSGTYRSLVPQCGVDGDSRVTNVVVLRAEHEMSAVTLSPAALPLAGTKIPGDSSVTVVKILGSSAGSAGVDDSLKPHTMYYYRFVTCGGLPGLYAYGEGREDSLATTGKLLVSATTTVSAYVVSDGSSDFNWEMFGGITFCGKILWSAPDGGYVEVTEGTTSGQLGIAVTAICSPDTDTCMVNFGLGDYDAGSGDDAVGNLAPTVIHYGDIAATKPTAGTYTFTSSKSYPFADESGTGAVNYYFSCKYVD